MNWFERFVFYIKNQWLLAPIQTTNVKQPVVEPVVEPVINPPEIPPETPEISPGEAVYNVLKSCIGKDMRTNKGVPSAYACAESINTGFKRATGKVIGGGASTNLMYKALLKDPRFQEIDKPEAFALIISPSGYSNKGFPTGHVGWIGKKCILSNNSITGVFDCYWTPDQWYTYYVIQRGFIVKYFRYIGG